MRRRILVTGGAGYIGDCAVKWLLERGQIVTVLDNLMYGGSYLRTHRNLRFVRGDVRDGPLVEGLIGSSDSVLHLAAIVGDGACAANPEETVDINEDATCRIAQLCTIYGRSMVFASTCSVYGANNDLLDENSITNPLSLYAGTKLNSERYVNYIKPPSYNFRLGTLFGLSTEHARLRCDLVANILTYKALQGQKLTVFGGEQWRPLLHVKDAAEIMAGAAIGIYEPGTYILSYQNYKIIDVAREIMETCELPDDHIKITDMKFEDLRNYKVDNTKSIGAGIEAHRTLGDGILEMSETFDRIANVWDVKFHNARYVKEVVNGNG